MEHPQPVLRGDVPHAGELVPGAVVIGWSPVAGPSTYNVSVWLTPLVRPDDDGLRSSAPSPAVGADPVVPAQSPAGGAHRDDVRAPGRGPSSASVHAQADAVAAATQAADPASPVPSSALPAILGDVPVAVLLIDQRTGEVTFANGAAMDLAGKVSLPVAADSWGAAAGLTDLDGRPLAGTEAPLSRVAAGEPLAGEPVRLSPRRSDDRERADAHDGRDDRLLWVTGFPMSTPVASAADRPPLSLVVFLPVADPEASDGEAVLQRLREGAVLATDVSFAISDPRQPDSPLVWVNPSFTRVTGWSFEEAVGRNCRFLQGPATDPAALAELRSGLAECRPVTVTLLNHRKDGSAIWTQLSVSPVLDGAGELVSFVGVQSDVSQRVVADAEQARALRAETVAREAAEQAQQRLLLMAEGTGQLSATLDTGELLDRLTGICVPGLGDWAFAVGLDEHGQVDRAAAAHRDGDRAELTDLRGLITGRTPLPGSPAAVAIADGAVGLIADLTPDALPDPFRNETGRRLVAGLGMGALLTVPMTARGRTLGVLSLVRTGSPFAPDDVEVATDLGRRAAMAMDNARLYQQEQSVAETLQRSLLPQLPDVPGVTAAAQYESAAAGAAVGGDFYDLIALPDGAVGIAIGDVAGHDIDAAAEMGQLRGLLRACAYEGGSTEPGRVLDRLVLGLGLRTLATVTYACACRDDDGTWTLHVATAGHPPLLVHGPDGAVRQLDEVRGLMIGVEARASRASVAHHLPAGSTVLAYTDGLVEHRGPDLDVGTAQLVAALAAVGPVSGPQELCSTAMRQVDTRLDDTACIGVTLH
ncbi:MAG: hypothetical protein JWQ53_2984 [Klenkia sp.]|nr:hypothetical protein [Klenkia sp.]